MSNKRPARSRFAGRVYRIEYLPPEEVKGDEGDSCWGTTDHSKQIIRVEDQLHHDKERATVIHETFHQILALVDAGLPENIEEKICTALGEALIGHIRDNPGYWRYILKRPPKDST